MSLRSRLRKLAERLKPRVWFTRRALWLALAVLAILVFGGIASWIAGVAAAAGLAALGIVLADMALVARARLDVRREPADRFVLGEAGVLRYALRNDGVTALRVWITEAAVPLLDIAEEPAVRSLAPGERATATAPVVPRDRGDALLGTFGVRIVTRLGLAARTTRMTEALPIRVWPDLSLLQQRGSLAQRRRTIAAGLRRLRFRGRGSDFESLREYAPGDAFRDIAWRATARRGKPIVVQQEIERSQTVVIALDAGRLMTPRVGAQRKFDYALAAALTLAGVATAEGDRVGIVAFAGHIVEYVPPGNGAPHAARLIERLHALQPRFEEADYEGAFAFVQRRQTKRSLFVLFTDMFDPVASQALLAHLALLVRRHLVIVVLLNDAAIANALDHVPRDIDGAYRAAIAMRAADDRALAIAALGRLGVGVIDVAADELSLALVNRYVAVKSRGAV
jgi:uncharacterized protein (DUF58 family)